MANRRILEGENVVAIFDILGFRALVHSTPPSDFRKLLHDVLYLSGAAPLDEDRVGSLVLSDTIVLYGRTSEAEANLFSVTVSSSNLLNAAARRGLPIRGALSTGPLLIDENNTSLVGVPVVSAYELQQRQEWMGAIMDPQCADRFETVLSQSVLPECALLYRAPMKSGPRLEYLCVGWTFRLAGDRRILEEAFPGADNSHDAWAKRQNTLAFFDFCEPLRDRSRYP